MEDASKSEVDRERSWRAQWSSARGHGERQRRRSHRVATPTGRWRPAARARPSTRRGRRVTVNGVKAAAANPYLGLVPDPSKIDWAYWKSHMAKKAEKRYA